MKLTARMPAIALIALASAATRAESPSDPIESLVRAERDFAALSGSSGMRQAFLANLCADAVVFRPAPTGGRALWQARPESRGVLRWAPDFAEVGGDGDLGCTSGPWEFAPAAGAQAVAFGHFVSIWRRAREESWCVALDIGISHDRTVPGVDSVELQRGPEHPRPPAAPSKRGITGLALGVFHRGVGIGVGAGSGVRDDAERQAHEANAMMSEERALAFDVRRLGFERAYPLHADADLRSYHEAAPPGVGIDWAVATLESRAREIEWRPEGRGLSSSFDLGYSYGLRLSRGAGAAGPDTASYLHVWRRTPPGTWKLALEIENPFSKR